MKYVTIISIAINSLIHQGPKTLSIQPKNDSLKFVDMSHYAILKLDNDKYKELSEKNAKDATLSTAEIVKIDGILNQTVEKYNISENKGKYPHPIYHPEKYYKQVIAIINSKGEKVVWVSCLCSIPDKSSFKKHLVVVMDGGSCYFQLKINLTKGTVYDFGVNGDA